MPDIARKPPAGLRPLGAGLPVEVLEWTRALRVIWESTGWSVGRFASVNPIDKGTISRYLNGLRVPRDRWFLDSLFGILADDGKPVTPAVREHVTQLHLRALQAAHPHEYKVRKVSEELEIALTGKRRAERHARALEEQLARRRREVREPDDDKGRLRAAWDDDRTVRQAGYERDAREIREITSQLHLARERAAQAERRCRQLEGLFDCPGEWPGPGSDNGSPPGKPREFEIAQVTTARGPAFGWITSVGPEFQITTPSRAACRLLGLSYEELDGSYVLGDPLLSSLQAMLGNFGEFALIIGMLARSALDGWSPDPGYPHLAENAASFFGWLGQYVRANREFVTDQVERAPAVLVDGDSSRNDLRQCLAAAAGDAEWPPFNFNRHNTMRMHIVRHPLLSGEVARFEKAARPFYQGGRVIGYEVTWNAENADEAASQLMRSVLAEPGVTSEDAALARPGMRPAHPVPLPPPPESGN
jgi:hypothetical protein